MGKFEQQPKDFSWAKGKTFKCDYCRGDGWNYHYLEFGSKVPEWYMFSEQQSVPCKCEAGDKVFNFAYDGMYGQWLENIQQARGVAMDQARAIKKIEDRFLDMTDEEITKQGLGIYKRWQALGTGKKEEVNEV